MFERCPLKKEKQIRKQERKFKIQNCIHELRAIETPKGFRKGERIRQLLACLYVVEAESLIGTMEGK